MAKPIRTLFYLCIFFIAIEFMLRIAGGFQIAGSARRNVVQPENAEKIRILVIGDSMSATEYGKPNWPELLERALKRSGVNVRVYNKAMSGTISATMASRLPSLIREIKPEIVVTMLGTSDFDANIRYDESSFSRLYLLISDLRLVKSMQWLDRWFEQAPMQEMDSTTKYEFDGYQIGGWAKLALKKDLPEIERIEAAAAKDKNTLAVFLSETGASLHDRNLNQLAVRYWERAFELAPCVRSVAFWELIYQSEQSLRAAHTILSLCSKNLPDDVFSYLLTYSLSDPQLLEGMQPLIRARGIALSAEKASPTAFNYRAIHKILKENRIAHIAVQYPTLPLASLQEYFQDTKGDLLPEARDIIFVSNQDNFLRAVKEMGSDKVFFDLSKNGLWGHALSYGAHLEAKAVLPAVLALVEKIRREQL